MTRSLRPVLVALAVATLGCASAAAASPPSDPPTVTSADRTLGRADAPVTVIEYASLVCPHCAQWHLEVLPAFKARFIDTGRVRLAYRDLPTPPAEVSAPAAALTRCAAADRAFDVVRALMQGQAALFEGGDVGVWFAQGVAASGRTQAEMVACVQDPATLAALRADTAAAHAAGVDGTPAFFVNGRRIQDHSLEGLAAAIEPLLAPSPRR